MAKWFLEPGHTAAEFCVRHMMVTYVRGHFKNVRGTLQFDPKRPEASRVEATIDARGISTGEPQRDSHLRSADFLDVENYPTITFVGSEVEPIGEHDLRVGVSWNAYLDRGGVVVGNDVDIIIDAEAILESTD